jgi:alanine dehydrogenase
VFNTTPGAVARTSTFALNNATIGHAVAIANKGWKQALVTSGFRSKSA